MSVAQATRLVLALLLLMSSTSTAVADHDCEEKFESSTGPAYKYATTVVKIDTRKKGKDIFSLPTDVVVGAFSLVPGIGYIVENAYASEDNIHYKATLKAPPAHLNYVYCGANGIYHSINPQKGKDRVVFGWTYQGKDHGTYVWRLRRLGLFEGGSSFIADLYWKTVPPGIHEPGSV